MKTKSKTKKTNTELVKEGVAADLYQKFGEKFFEHPDSEYFLDCLAFMSGDTSFKSKAIAHVGESFICDCIIDRRNDENKKSDS